MLKEILLLGVSISISCLSFGQLTDEVIKELNPANFNKNFQSYDQSTALFTAHLANIVYEEEATIGKYVNELNKTYPAANYVYQFIDHKASSTQALFFGNESFIVIAFRGTQEKKDMLTDAKLIGVGGKIDKTKSSACPHLPAGHDGFRESLMNLIDASEENIFGKLDGFIENTLKSDKAKISIHLTGHSLGAALSSLFVLPLKNRGYVYGGGYNFAPPLAIAKADANAIISDASIHNLTYDIVNNTDYVTSMPNYSRKKMRHIGKYYRICSISSDVPKVFNEKEENYKLGIFQKFSLRKVRIDKHHALSSYIQGVRNAENTSERIVNRSTNYNSCSCLEPKCD